jgi:squalene synthase HpnC
VDTNRDVITAARNYLPSVLADDVPHLVCERLARAHYENFTIGSLLMPRRLRSHIYNIYAYCRVCDDLADETGDPQLSLRLLDWWREQLEACYAGSPGHPVFRALRDTVDEFGLPKQPFLDLIDAFVQDQTVRRYATFDDLLGYCSRSANPVGRLVLKMLGYEDPVRCSMSDATCTALQLTNFWQDIHSDFARGRVYIPTEDMERFGYSEHELAQGIRNAAFCELLRFEISRTREFFERGKALSQLVPPEVAVDIALFTQGGLAMLGLIERRQYQVFSRRIKLSRTAKLAIFARWALRHIATRKTGVW